MSSKSRALPKFRITCRSEEHTSELQSRENLVCRLLLEKKKTYHKTNHPPISQPHMQMHGDINNIDIYCRVTGRIKVKVTPIESKWIAIYCDKWLPSTRT